MSLEELVRLLSLFFGPHNVVGQIAEEPRLLLAVVAVSLLGISATLIRHSRYRAGALIFFVAVLLSAGYWVLSSENALTGHVEPRFDRYDGYVLIGGDLPDSRPSQSSAVECQRLCAAENQCRAFTFDSKTRSCHLKRAVVTLHEFPAAVSGVKHALRNPDIAK